MKTTTDAREILELLPVSLRRVIVLAKEKGSSTWLTALPLIEHGFALHKGAFHDALALRYGWTPSEMPSICANRQDGARLDIAANGFWGGTFERTFFDVRVLNPHAPSNRHTQLSSCYRKHMDKESEKLSTPHSPL